MKKRSTGKRSPATKKRSWPTFSTFSTNYTVWPLGRHGACGRIGICPVCGARGAIRGRIITHVLRYYGAGFGAASWSCIVPIEWLAGPPYPEGVDAPLAPLDQFTDQQQRRGH